MKKIIDKIKNWYRGERVEDWMNTGPLGLPEVWYRKSTSARIANWIVENWKILLPVFATLTGVFVAACVSLFIHFDNKSKREAAQKHGEPPKQVRADVSQKLVIHNQSTSLRKAKPTPTTNKPIGKI